MLLNALFSALVSSDPFKLLARRGAVALAYVSKASALTVSSVSRSIVQPRFNATTRSFSSTSFHTFTSERETRAMVVVTD